MGYWGMGIAQSDEYCEVYDQFMESYDAGKPVQEIAQKILKEYHEEFSDDDGIMHDVYFALAKAEWMCCVQSDAVLNRVEQIIASGANILFYRELGATESDLKARKKYLEKFLTKLQTPRAAPRKRKPRPENGDESVKKGMVFWYRSKGAVYGALVLEVVCQSSILVALSEKLEGEPKSAEAVLEANVYTAAWFNALLPPKRVHELGTVSVFGNYNGRAGLYRTGSVWFCENIGMDYQWTHEECFLHFPNRKMRDLLNAENVPIKFRRPERMELVLKSNHMSKRAMRPEEM